MAELRERAREPRVRARGAIGAIAMALVLASFTITGVAAATPRNDDFGDAIVATELPFRHDVDTSHATGQGIGDFCGEDLHSVWYRFTPTQDMLVEVSVDAGFDATVEVMSGTRDRLTHVACADDPPELAFQAIAGTRYHIRLDSCCGSPGGAASIGIVRFRPPVIDVTVDRGWAEKRTGEALVEGTYLCRRAPDGAYLTVGIRQRMADGTIAQGQAAKRSLTCDGERYPYQKRVLSPFAFDPGWARVSARGIACRPSMCDRDSTTRIMRLRAVS